MLNKLLIFMLCISMCISNISVYANQGRYTLDELLTTPILQRGDELTPKNWTSIIRPDGYATIEKVEVTGEDFTEAVQVKVSQRGNNNWASQLWVDMDTKSIKTGDIVLVAYKIKPIETSDETEMVRLGVYVRPTGTSSNRSAAPFESPVTDEWVQEFGVGRITDSGNDSGVICMHVGHAIQTFQIADLRVINFGTKIPLEQFPEKEIKWHGMEEDAKWRKEALERIEKIRKSDIEVNVVDAAGNPIQNANISVEQQRHAFGHGSLLSVSRFKENNQERKQKYLDLFLSMFNLSGFENAMKMHQIETSANDIDNMLTWLEEHDTPSRGHVFIWKISQLPNQNIANDSEELRKFLIDHITKYADRYKERILTWDVANEQIPNPQFINIVGKDEMINWFKAARENDPYARLALTDYGILGGDIGKRDAFYDMIKFLVDKDAEIDVIGMQGHVGTAAYPENVLRVLDRFAGFGLDIEITEFTIGIADEEKQGMFVKDFLTAVYSHPAVSSILTWGFIEGSINEHNAAMVRSDFSLKPSGEAWMDLLFNKWWTNEEGTTGIDGRFLTRAYHGKQKITVEIDGKQANEILDIDFKGKKITAVYNGNEISFNNPEVYEDLPEPDKKLRIVNEVSEKDADEDDNKEPEEKVYSGPKDIEFHWARGYVEKMISIGIVSGYDDGTFRPENNVNVDGFIKMCVAAGGYKVTNSPGYWGDSWIDKAIDLGYIKKGDFDSYQRAISREEIAFIVSNILNDKHGELGLIPSDIEDAKKEYKDSIEKMCSLGIINGYEDGSFRPKNNATRAESVVIIERILNVK